MVVDKTVSVVKQIKSRIETAKNEDPSATPWVKQVAMLTGVLAAMAGFLEVRSTTITNDAIYESNQAILAQTQASDAWSEYQAESIKARIVETALVTSPTLGSPDKGALTDEDKTLRDAQSASKKDAEAKTEERDSHLKNGMARLNERDLLGYAGLASQLGIALASVAALVRWRAPFIAGIFAGCLGAGLAGYVLAAQHGFVL